MHTPLRSLRFVAAIVLLPIATACGGSGESDDAADWEVAASESPDSIPACALLTDAEVTEALGPHGPPQRDPGFGGCVWYGATNEAGYSNKVAVAVVPSFVYEQVAEIGEPIEGFGSGATYAEIRGELWFRCQTDKHCGIQLILPSGKDRAAEARRLGRLVKSRA